MQKNYPQFPVKLINNNIQHWVVTMEGADGTIYKGEQYE